MSERIGVTYLAIQGAPGTCHMALFYEDNNGFKKVIEAGPRIPESNISSSAVFSETVKEAFSSSNENTGSPFGFIVGAGVRDWSDGVPNLDGLRAQETLVTGDDLGAKWGALVAAATEALALHYEYRPVEQNSVTGKERAKKYPVAY
jgi:hypothetical protein